MRLLGGIRLRFLGWGSEGRDRADNGVGEARRE